MFQNVIANKNVAECIGCIQTDTLTAIAAEGYEGFVPVPNIAGSTSCLIQVSVDPDDLPVGVSFDTLGSKPIVTVNEGPDAIGVVLTGSPEGFSIPGVKMVNFGTYLVEAPKNLNQVKVIPTIEDLKVYVVFTFYK